MNNEYLIRVQMFNGYDNGTPVPAIKVKSNLSRREYRDLLEQLLANVALDNSESELEKRNEDE